MIERFTAEQAKALTSVEVQYAKVIDRIKQSVYDSKSYFLCSFICEDVQNILIQDGFKLEPLTGSNIIAITW